MYRQHRQRFLDRLAQDGAAAVVATGSAKIRNHDSEHRFRPESDFWYLTGFREPDSVLVLAPHRDEERVVLFLREKDRAAETWTGRRLGVEAAPEALGVDAAYPIGELWERLPELLRGAGRLVYRAGADEARDRELLRVVGQLRAQVRGGALAPLEIVDPALSLHEQRLFKGPEELACMRRAAAVTAEAHVLAMHEAEPEKSETDLDALIDFTFRRRGSTGSAYTNIVAGGANACILHYIENDQPLRDGELVLIDAGAEWDYYASDVTRTFPVNGRFTPEQRALYDVVLDAQKAGIAAVRPGASFVSVHEVALRRLCEGMLGLGILKGELDEVIESGAYRAYYMHRTGHWLGLDVHDCGAYHEDGASRILAPGMVTTVEPGLYLPPDDEALDPRWRGIGIRIEDDVAVDEAGHEVLTAAIPKEVADVEAACRGAERVSVRVS